MESAKVLAVQVAMQGLLGAALICPIFHEAEVTRVGSKLLGIIEIVMDWIQVVCLVIFSNGVHFLESALPFSRLSPK